MRGNISCMMRDLIVKLCIEHLQSSKKDPWVKMKSWVGIEVGKGK